MHWYRCVLLTVVRAVEWSGLFGCNGVLYGVWKVCPLVVCWWCAVCSQGQGTNYSFVGSTALQWACAKGHLACARWLLGRGADARLGNAAGATPLHAAVTHEHLEVVQLLMLGAGADAQVRAAAWLH